MVTADVLVLKGRTRYGMRATSAEATSSTNASSVRLSLTRCAPCCSKRSARRTMSGFPPSDGHRLVSRSSPRSSRARTRSANATRSANPCRSVPEPGRRCGAQRGPSVDASGGQTGDHDHWPDRDRMSGEELDISRQRLRVHRDDDIDPGGGDEAFTQQVDQAFDPRSGLVQGPIEPAMGSHQVHDELHVRVVRGHREDRRQVPHVSRVQIDHRTRTQPRCSSAVRSSLSKSRPTVQTGRRSRTSAPRRSAPANRPTGRRPALASATWACPVASATSCTRRSKGPWWPASSIQSGATRPAPPDAEARLSPP